MVIGRPWLQDVHGYRTSMVTGHPWLFYTTHHIRHKVLTVTRPAVFPELVAAVARAEEGSGGVGARLGAVSIHLGALIDI